MRSLLPVKQAKKKKEEIVRNERISTYSYIKKEREMDTEKNDSNRQQRKKEKDGPDKNDTNTWQGQRDERKVMRLKENTNRQQRKRGREMKEMK